MQDQEPPDFFSQKRASSYDEQRAKLAPMRDALNFLIRMQLAELPDEARVLCVGVGTGSELIDLAQAYPQWRFTAVEPAAPMIEVCRQRAGALGIDSRCTFHEGYLESLPQSAPFDAATCILVSHFLIQAQARRNLFAQIAKRLKPNACLVNADLSSDTSTPAHKDLFEVWARTLRHSDMPAEDIDRQLASLGRDVAVLPPRDIESIMASGGFASPVAFFQALFIHAWCARAL